MKAEKSEILYFSCIPWHYAWHRQQEMMQYMAERGFRVLFVEPCLKRRPFSSEMEQISDRLWRLRPCGLPYERCLRSVQGVNAILSRREIDRAMEKLGFQDPMIWADRVHGWDFGYYQRNRFVVYDLVDDLFAFGRMKNRPMLMSLENRILKRADLLLSSSRTLMDRKIRQSGRKGLSLFLPNGVDCARFEGIRKQDPGKGNPFTLGFVGTISKRRLNYDLIRETARKRPAWRLVFAGPGRETEKEELASLSANIEVLDAVEGTKIPELMGRVDAGWIPYHTDRDDMDYVFPRKAFEYLAAGKTVVSTPLKEVQDLGPYILTADSADAFIEKIEGDSVSADERIRFARLYEWEQLMGTVMTEFRKHGFAAAEVKDRDPGFITADKEKEENE